MNTVIGFDELFALRVMYQDTYENEYDIIRELKMELLNIGMSIDDIPTFLKDFYNHFGILLSIEQINEALAVNSDIDNIQNAIMMMFNSIINNQEQHNESDSDDSSDNHSNATELIENIDNNGTNIIVVATNNNNDDDSDDNDSDSDSDNEIPSQPITSINLNTSPITFTQQLASPLINHLNMPIHNLPMHNLPGPSLENMLASLLTNPYVPTYYSPSPYIFNQQSISGNISNIISGLNAFSHSSSLPSTTIDDVVCILDESEQSKLKKYKLESVSDNPCSICMTILNKDDEACELPCEHIFHDECIQPWLNNYNYKCPICRKEVGKPKYVI